MDSDALGCRKPCIYFTRLTVSEDGHYLPLPLECQAQFLEQAATIPAIQSILRAYTDRFGIDLLSEMQCPSAKDVDQRVLEAGMYAAFAFFLEHSLGLTPNAVTFYSSGVAPALMFAHALSPRAYLESLGSIQQTEQPMWQLRSGWSLHNLD